MKIVCLFGLLLSSQVFSSELSLEVKQAFEQDQKSICSVKPIPSLTKDPVFAVFCENSKIASSFTIFIQDNKIGGSGETWLKNSSNQGECEVSGAVVNEKISSLEIYCLSK